MAGPFLVRDYSHYVQKEAAFNTSPGALAGTDAFKSRTASLLKRIVARSDRTKDKDNNQASVLTTQVGREKSSFSVTGSVIPSGNAATPTAPDMDPFFEAHFGGKHTATAHTTTAAGSTGVTLELTPGGGAASGIAAKDIIVVDVSAAAGLEARQVVEINTDTVTVDRAFTSDPAAARAVYVGTTYFFTEANLISLYLWEFVNGDNFRHKAGGCIARNLELSIDGNSETPETSVTVSGEGCAISTGATTIPTPTTAGQPHNPAEAKVFIGASGKLCPVSASVKSDNGIELRESEFCTLTPSGVKRTGNDSRYMVEQTLSMLVDSATKEGYFDGVSALTAYDVIVQLGIEVGKIVAWRTKKWIPEASKDEAAGEVAITLSGRAYGTSGDDELAVAFI